MCRSSHTTLPLRRVPAPARELGVEKKRSLPRNFPVREKEFYLRNKRRKKEFKTPDDGAYLADLRSLGFVSRLSQRNKKARPLCRIAHTLLITSPPAGSVLTRRESLR